MRDAHRQLCIVLNILPVVLGEGKAPRRQRKGGRMIEVPLTKGYVAVIDDEYWELVAQHRWRVLVQPHGQYAIAALPRRNGKQRTLSMHRLILDAGSGQMVDHIDKDGLNNKRGNLRFCTKAQNAQNRRHLGGESPYRGVFWYKKSGRWGARITARREERFLGLFSSEEEAARAYDRSALELHEQFANLNFPV